MDLTHWYIDNGDGQNEECDESQSGHWLVHKCKKRPSKRHTLFQQMHLTVTKFWQIYDHKKVKRTWYTIKPV